MMRRTRVKICGVRDLATARVAIEAGADALGFVFYERSPRCIEPGEASEIIERLPPWIVTVGLFVDAPAERVERTRRTCGLDAAQLHGGESEDLVRQCGSRLLKAVRFDVETIERELRRWSAVAEVGAILVDGSSGGRGASFDWSALASHRGASTKPIILAGGLTPATVGEAIRIVKPEAVDVSSGVESSPGEKDAELIRAFCASVRLIDEQLESD